MYKIKYIKNKILNYFEGMNSYAAKDLNIPFPYPKNDIVIVKGLSKEKERWLLEHESMEIDLMKSGLSYREAHAKTLLRMKDYKTKSAALKDADRMIARAKRR